MDLQQAEELRKARLELCRKTINFEKVDRILNKSFFVTWKYYDAGYKLSEAMNDLKKIEEANIRHQELYNFDLFTENGSRNAYRVNTALGEPGYHFDDEHYAISVSETEYVDREALKDFAANPKKFIWEVLMPKRYHGFFETHDVEAFENSYKELMAFFAMTGNVNKRLAEEYGVPIMTGAGTPANPVEWITNRLRGIKGFCLDMRQAPDLLDDVVAAFKETVYMPAYENLLKMPDGHNPNAAFDSGTALLSHNVLNTKQWDKYYWPFLGKTLDTLKEKNMNINIFMQGEGIRFFDYLKDYPKGMLIMSLEKDDLVTTRKLMPNAVLSGGMPLCTLGYASPEECVATAKKAIDSLDGVGFILSEDKMGTYPNDATRENLKAVCDFVANYRL